MALPCQVCRLRQAGPQEGWTAARPICTSTHRQAPCLRLQLLAGYGNTGPQKCWVAAWLICFQSIGNVLLNAIVLGLMFAKVASPKASLL